MTTYVDSIAGAAHQLDVVSPELALVDPELGRAARAHLSDTAQSAARARRLAAPSRPAATSLAWSVESTVRAREGSSRRLLFGVAAVTMLALLLFDVRVEVGQRPAVAELESTGTGLGTLPTSLPRAPQTTKRPLTVGPAPASSERKFAWAPFVGASGYHVEFFSGSERVFAADSTRSSLTVPARWTFGGHRQSLRPGEYGWYVWPIVDGRRQSRAIVQTSLRIPRS